MRYLILKPREATFDPRHSSIRDPSHLHELIPLVADCAFEGEAVDAVRRMFPSAVGMPFTIKVGGTVMVLLGLLEDPGRPIDKHDNVPFVLFVQALPESRQERKLLEEASVGERPLFDKKVWALKPVRPELARTIPIEWRTTENDTPIFLDAQVGYDNGRLVLYAQLGSEAFSVAFPSGKMLVDDKPTTPVG